jgi:cellulose synthase/poly-beta-1,6-N-acetylglucosamine synthase-like glycosyltransferase
MLEFIDSVVFIVLGVFVLYLFVFALFASRRRGDEYPPAREFSRVAVLFPAYREDAVIVPSVKSFLEQDYPKDMFDVVVISDHMREETVKELSELPIILFTAHYANSSKAKALNFAMTELADQDYDVAIILDADNTVRRDFLRKVNNAFYSGVIALQAHRVAKNRNTPTAILDAFSEEMNNSIFRKGHVRLGLSSALIGSGMAFDFKWFLRHIPLVVSTGEDKELETLLLKEGTYIEYLEDVEVYDQKVEKESTFYNQRRRWIFAQLDILKSSLHDLPHAIFTGNADYADKLFQWMMPPRIILLGMVAIYAAGITLVAWDLSFKWWFLFFMLLLAIAMATPDYIVDANFKRTIKKVPVLFLLMVANIFRMRGAGKKFIHTPHGDVEVDYEEERILHEHEDYVVRIKTAHEQGGE